MPKYWKYSDLGFFAFRIVPGTLRKYLSKNYCNRGFTSSGFFSYRKLDNPLFLEDKNIS